MMREFVLCHRIKNGAAVMMEDMVDGNWNWRALDRKGADLLIAHVSPVDGEHVLCPSSMSAQWYELSFYECVQLVRVHDQSWAPDIPAFYYLLAGRDLYRLRGDGAPIHAVNEGTGFRVRAANVRSYLKFFCSFITVDEAPVRLIDMLDEIVLPVSVDRQMRARLTLRLEEFAGQAPEQTDDGFICETLIAAENGIREAVFEVSKSGFVAMLDDQLVLDFRDQDG